mgnify:CR=1 FL=1
MNERPGFTIPKELEPYPREITVDGLRLHLYAAGRGPALVLLHGLADEADSWRQVIPVLAQTHRVIAPDLPGFGRSDRPMSTGIAGPLGRLHWSTGIAGPLGRLH